jgi:hypothetical protein
MIEVPRDTNTIYVSMVPSKLFGFFCIIYKIHILDYSGGCFKEEFDSTYPVHLKGILSQDEFQDSIDRINRTIISNKILFILAIIFAASMISGMIFIIIGGIIEANSDTSGFITLLVVTVLGLIVFGIGYCFIHCRHVTRIRQAIDEESMKYSLRLSVPCNWRLETTGNYFGGFGKNYVSRILSSKKSLFLFLTVGN